MNKFQVTLNFKFEETYIEDYGYMSEEEEQEKQDAYDRTEKYYQENSLVEHIKSFEPMELVGYILMDDDGEVVSAEWDAEKFQIHMTVTSENTAEDIRETLRSNSLEDGEYEAYGETGWLLFTRGPEGETFNGGMEEGFWNYGCIDYRENPILITKLD
jgi:hypothetical protein